MIVSKNMFPCLLGANAGVTDKLVGAKNADVSEFPYQVSLRLKGKHFCGGALITKKHVLTAAHCVAAVKSTGLSSLSAVVGTNSVSSGGSTYKIKALSSHPSYVNRATPDWMYDIGVITVSVLLLSYVSNVSKTIFSLINLFPTAHF